MSDVVRAALVQAEWTGDKESMVDKNVQYALEAADQGAQILCFQEIFNTSYFCAVQDTIQRMIALAKETGMVLIVPIYERVDEGTFYNTAAVINDDGDLLGIYRKMHIPQVEGFWEKFYFKPGNLGYPVFDTAVGRIGVYICTFPRDGGRSASPERRSFSTLRRRRGDIRNICGSWSSRRRPSPTSTTSVPSTGWAQRISRIRTTTDLRTSSTRGEISLERRPPTATMK